MWRGIALFLALALFGAGAAVILPRAEHALALRLAADDPAQLAALRLKDFDGARAAAEIEAALAADDIEMAESFVALADRREVEIPAELKKRVADLGSAVAELKRSASRFGRGFLTGNPDGTAGLVGAATGDLLVYGDIRDLAREGGRWLRGEKVDPLMAGLATAGLAVTAGTYFAGGAGAPARAGVTLFKAARRGGKIGAGLATDVTRIARSGRSGRAFSAFADLGRIEGKAGARTALESLRYADNVKDIARVGRLAEKSGSTTLAVLKTLGRGAIVLGAGAVTGALWVMGAATNVFLLVLAISTVIAWIVRMLWRAGRLAWRGGRFAVVQVTAARA